MTDLGPDRLASLRARLVETDTDLLAVGPGPHMHWLLGFHPHPDERPCLLLVSQTSETFLMPVLNAEGSRERVNIPFHTWSDAEGPVAALQAALAELGIAAGANVAVDETMRSDFSLLLLDQLPGGNRSYAADTVGVLRMQKDDSEFAKLRMNSAIADAAMLKAFAAIKPGLIETQVGDVVREHFASEAAAPLFVIIGTGSNGAFPHHATGDRVLAEGDAVVIDIGARKGNYSSDITRMAVVGHKPDGYAEVHEVVERAVQAALKAARPGVAAKEVDLAARNVIADAGYGDYFVHRTGHGMGLEGHEPPFLTSTSETVLQAGMVFSIEPGIYLPGRFGIRLEEIVILHEDGPEVVSKLPRTLHVAG